MEDLRFSIVIPTRERAETLKYCLKTCVEQEEFQNYEIIVSDNNSSPATKEVVEAFNCDKIKYFSTGKTLAMHENFEFAVSHAKGEYVIFLGDDDGILLKGLYNLNQIIEKTCFKAIAWQWIFYYWPEGVPIGVENLMYIPISSNVTVVNGKNSIKEVVQFKKPYSQLPMLYINGAIHRDLIAELRTKTGGVFFSVTPDCYSAICFAYLSKSYLFLDRPISIAAISKKSNGNNHLYKKWNNEISNEYDSLNNSSSIQFHKKVPFIRSLNAIVSEAFIQAKEKLFKDDNEMILDRKTMILNILKDLVIFEKEEWLYTIGIIKNSLNDDIELLKWFDNILIDHKPQITNINKTQAVETGININTLIINGSSFGCKNVYDVATFYNKFLESKIQIPENVKMNESIYASVKKASIMIRSFRRLKLAGRIILKGY